MFSGMDSPKLSYVPIIIGIGNDYRGDDAAGLIVARKIAELASGRVKVVESSGDAAALMDLWEKSDLVVAVDAVSSGDNAGRIYRFEPIMEPIPEALFSRSSTHDFGLHEAIELSRALDRLPRRLVVYGIAGTVFENGNIISEQVALSIEQVTQKVLEELTMESDKQPQ